jgi:hypothetical protein
MGLICSNDLVTSLKTSILSTIANATASVNETRKRIPVRYVWHTDKKFACTYLFINKLEDDTQYNFIPYVFPNPIQDLPCYEGSADPN